MFYRQPLASWYSYSSYPNLYMPDFDSGPWVQLAIGSYRVFHWNLCPFLRWYSTPLVPRTVFHFRHILVQFHLSWVNFNFSIVHYFPTCSHLRSNQPLQRFYSNFDWFRIDASSVSSASLKWSYWRNFLMTCGKSRQDFGQNRVYYIMAFIIVLPWVWYFLISPYQVICCSMHNFFAFVRNSSYSFWVHSIDSSTPPWTNYDSYATIHLYTLNYFSLIDDLTWMNSMYSFCFQVSPSAKCCLSSGPWCSCSPSIALNSRWKYYSLCWIEGVCDSSSLSTGPDGLPR